MFAALILCSAMLTADPEVRNVRVVNELDNLVTLRVRVLEKDKQGPPEVDLKSAQSKSLVLPRDVELQVEIHDWQGNDLTVSSQDFSIILNKDPKAEIYIVEDKSRPKRSVMETSEVEVREIQIQPNGTVEELVMKVPKYTTTLVPVIHLLVYSEKKYHPLDKFIKENLPPEGEPTPAPPQGRK